MASLLPGDAALVFLKLKVCCPAVDKGASWMWAQRADPISSEAALASSEPASHVNLMSVFLAPPPRTLINMFSSADWGPLLVIVPSVQIVMVWMRGYVMLVVHH